MSGRLWRDLTDAAWPELLPLDAAQAACVRADAASFLAPHLRRASWPIRLPVLLALPVLWIWLAAGVLCGVPRSTGLARFEPLFGSASRGVVRVLRSVVYLAAFEHALTRAALGLPAFEVRQREFRELRRQRLEAARGA